MEESAHEENTNRDADRDANLVLAIDPGSAKCGVALVARDRRVLHRVIVPAEALTETVAPLVAAFRPFRLLIGDGTGSRELRERLQIALAMPVETVSESHTSEAARARFLAENPARGLEKLLPRSLRTPSEPYDDWVAVILAERFWAEQVSAARLRSGESLLRGSVGPDPDLDLPRSAPPPR